MSDCAGGCAKSACEKEASRAQFLRGTIGTFAFMWSVMAAYPFYLYLRPNKTDSKVKVASVDIGTVGDIPPGTGKNFKFGSTPAIVTHTKDGEFHAFSAICTHLGCTVQFRDDLQEIWCACHGGCYDAATGKNISGPPPKPLTMLKVTVKDDHITVSKA